MGADFPPPNKHLAARRAPVLTPAGVGILVFADHDVARCDIGRPRPVTFDRRDVSVLGPGTPPTSDQRRQRAWRRRRDGVVQRGATDA